MPKGKKEKKNPYSIITDQVIKLLKEGVVPWRKPWAAAGGGFAKNLITGKEYKGINAFILSSSSYDSQYWLTYNQAKKQGGTVKKGEKGTSVVFWSIFEKEEEGSDEKKKVFFLKYYTVFNLKQTENVKVPKSRIETKPVVNALDSIEKAEKIVNEMPKKPEVKFGMSRASYAPSTDLVRMPDQETFDCSEEFYSVYFHELAHSTSHVSRLNRKVGTRNILENASEAYSKEELIAEMAACFLNSEAGIVNKTIDNSASYLQCWISELEGDSRLLVEAASKAQKAANFILNK